MKKKKKELTARVLLRVDGVLQPWESLPEEQREQIKIEINEQSMKALGYEKVETTS